MTIKSAPTDSRPNNTQPNAMCRSHSPKDLHAEEISCTAELEENDNVFLSKFKSEVASSGKSKTPELVQSLFGVYVGSNDSTFIYMI